MFSAPHVCVGMVLLIHTAASLVYESSHLKRFDMIKSSVGYFWVASSLCAKPIFATSILCSLSHTSQPDLETALFFVIIALVCTFLVYLYHNLSQDRSIIISTFKYAEEHTYNPRLYIDS